MAKSRKTQSSVSKQIRSALIAFEAKSRELKWFNQLNVANFATAGAIHPITQGIVQGDTNSTRDGNSLNIKNLSFTLGVAGNLSNTTGDRVRLIIFADTQNQGATPAVTDLLVTATVTAPLSRFVFITKRFKMLYDSTIVVGNQGASNQNVVRKVSLNLKNHHVEYLGSAATAADNGAGAVFYLVISDNGTFLSDYDLNVMVKYYDS